MSGRCALLGHQVRFEADGTTMRWMCTRSCGLAGSKDYPTPADASRYAEAFNRTDSSRVGTRAPLIGLAPLRLWRWLQQRRAV